MEARAIAKYLRISPRKTRLCADLIRGKRAEEAVNILSHTPKAGAKLISKVVQSALANARQVKSIDVDTLWERYDPQLREHGHQPMSRNLTLKDLKLAERIMANLRQVFRTSFRVNNNPPRCTSTVAE